MTIFFDTSPLIYMLDNRRPQVADQFARWLAAGEDFASSYVTLAELLVHPKRLGDQQREARYRLYLRRMLTLPLITVGEHVAELAAGIRAEYGFKTPDAFQLAAAVSIGADIFYTNDQHLQRFAGLAVMLVDG